MIRKIINFLSVLILVLCMACENPAGGGSLSTEKEDVGTGGETSGENIPSVPSELVLSAFQEVTDTQAVAVSFDNNVWVVTIDDTAQSFGLDAISIPIVISFDNTLASCPLSLEVVETEDSRVTDISDISFSSEGRIAFTLMHNGIGSVDGVRGEITVKVITKDASHASKYTTLPEITISTVRKTNEEALLVYQFIQNIDGKSFKTRNDIGSSEIIISYEVAGETVVKTERNDVLNTESKKTFHFDRVTENTAVYSSGSAMSENYENIVVTKNDDGSILTIGEKNYLENFVDAGVYFVDKIKGRVFKSTNGTGQDSTYCTYTFSDEGTSLLYKTQKWGETAVESSYDADLHNYDSAEYNSIEYTVSDDFTSLFADGAEVANTSNVHAPVEFAINLESISYNDVLIGNKKIEIIDSTIAEYGSSKEIALSFTFSENIENHPITINGAEPVKSGNTATITIADATKSTASGVLVTKDFNISAIKDNTVYDDFENISLELTRKLKPVVLRGTTLSTTTANTTLSGSTLTYTDTKETYTKGSQSIAMSLCFEGAITDFPLTVVSNEETKLEVSNIVQKENSIDFTLQYNDYGTTDGGVKLQVKALNDAHAENYSFLPEIQLTAKRTTPFTAYAQDLLDSFKTSDVSAALSDSKGYYTEIKLPKLDYVKNVPSITYNVSRTDDAKSNKSIFTGSLNTNDENPKDYNALMLRKEPTYTLSLTSGGITVTSVAKAGSRKLTNRELTLAAMESIRYALIDNGWQIMGENNLIKDQVKENSDKTFKHYRDYKYSSGGSYHHYYTFTNYAPHFIKVNDGFNYRSHTSLSVSNKTNAHSIYSNLAPFTGTVNFTSPYGNGSLNFNSININNNDWNNPGWNGGTLDVTANGETIKYANNGTVPFSFYMNYDTFKGIIAPSGEYTQK